MGTTMKFDSDDVRFWQTEGINHLRFPFGPEHYDGDENVLAAVNMCKGTIRDIGCGYGRFARYFTPANYTGYDICETVVKKAIRFNPTYTFKHWNFEDMPYADTTIFINGPHLVSHDEISELFQIMMKNTKSIIIGEMMDTSWVSPFEYTEYRRTIHQYDELLKDFIRVETYIGEHATWKKPFTTARWERV